MSLKIIENKGQKSTIVAMGSMKPLQVGKLTDGSGDYVMRTQDSENFEVMNLSECRIDECWDKPNDLQVRFLAAD